MYRTLFLLITLTLLNYVMASDQSLLSLFPSTNPRKYLQFAELCAYDGYRCETHYVITCDGYILTLFHIYPNKNCTVTQPTPTLVQHGLYLSCADCIIPGPGKANCYILADACFDVWVGNNRGNQFGRNHTTLDPDSDPEFWNFSFDEMALCDMPAIIDYILLVTGKAKINFIGHSQGVTAFILLCAQREEYNDKVQYAVGLSTATWLNHTRLLALEVQAALANVFRTPYGEIFRYGGAIQTVADIACATSGLSYPYCSVLIFVLFGYNNFTICEDTIAVALGHEPSGTSFINFLRWGQIRNNGFTRFDYGCEKNLKVYGSCIPPCYDLSKFRVPFHLITSYNDYVCDPQDQLILMSHLTGCSRLTQCVLSRKYFCHIDYIYSDEIPVAIAPIYLKFFTTGEATCT